MLFRSAVESGAGASASISDADYSAAGASIGDRAATLAGADIILGVQGPAVDSLGGQKPGAMLAAGLNPFGERARVDAYAAAGIEALAGRIDAMAERLERDAAR